MYVKPELVSFGSLRDVTLIGLHNDCDGGFLGVVSAGDAFGCKVKGRSS
jgi:hypothetical protein